MLFTHDTQAALVSGAALVNTSSGTDRLATPQDLDRFLDEQQVSGRRDGSPGELQAVRRLREELRRMWLTTGADELAGQVNAMLERTGARPQLVRHDGWGWHLHVTDPGAPLAERMGAEAAMAMLDVVRAQEVHRLRTCAADGCRAVLVDLSRNSSRRFCDTGNCANRTHVAASRARRRAGGAGATERAAAGRATGGE